MYREARAGGVRGAYMKCVTHHTFSQRTAYTSGGTPVALYLGGVPRWVVYEPHRDDQDQPISTAVVYVPLRRGASRPILLTPRRQWLLAHVEATRQPRHPGAAAPWDGATDLEVTWQGDRRVATIHVLRAGPDLVERLEEHCQWLLAGHIEHIGVFVSASCPRAAAEEAELSDLGLFLGGWIPDLYREGGDVLIYQYLARDQIDAGVIHTWGPLGSALKNNVLAAWEQTRSGALAA